LESNANRKLEAQLDENSYNESQLFSVKIPANHFGYYINSKQFERVDGQIEINGIEYSYVKRRLYHDSVELLCIPNSAAMQLNTARNEFFKLTNDLQRPGQNKKSDSSPPSYKSFSSDYYGLSDLFSLSDIYFKISKRSFYYSAKLSSTEQTVNGQPPEMIA
jgi:hypothetical protein